MKLRTVYYYYSLNLFYQTDLCNNNNLWKIQVIFPCRRGFSVSVIISGIFPYTNPSLVYFIFKATLLVAISCTPLVDQPFLIYFICVFIG